MTGVQGLGSAANPFLAQLSQSIPGAAGMGGSLALISISYSSQPLDVTDTGGPSGGTWGGQSSVSISAPGQLFNELQQLQSQDPTAFTQVVSEIAGQLQAAAQQEGSGAEANVLSALAQKFQNVANGGDLSQLLPQSQSQSQSTAAAYTSTGTSASSPSLLDLVPQSTQSGDSSGLAQLFATISNEVTQALGGSTQAAGTASPTASSSDLPQVLTNILSDVANLFTDVAALFGDVAQAIEGGAQPADSTQAVNITPAASAQTSQTSNTQTSNSASTTSSAPATSSDPFASSAASSSTTSGAGTASAGGTPTATSTTSTNSAPTASSTPSGASTPSAGSTTSARDAQEGRRGLHHHHGSGDSSAQAGDNAGFLQALANLFSDVAQILGG